MTPTPEGLIVFYLGILALVLYTLYHIIKNGKEC